MAISFNFLDTLSEKADTIPNQSRSYSVRTRDVHSALIHPEYLTSESLKGGS